MLKTAIQMSNTMKHLTDAQLLELAEIGNQYIYTAQTPNGREVGVISSGGIIAILNKYHEMQQTNE